MQQSVFTVGHSNHTQAHLLALLAQHAIGVLCDVRSTPVSRFNPQFDREELQRALPPRGIRYLFLGKELGARSDDPACHENGRVRYERLALTEGFQRGLSRVRDGVGKGLRIALMRAEKEPLECHRTILIARQLAAAGIDVHHIHADGRLETHGAALRRLISLLGLPEHDLFHTREELEAEGYLRQEARISYEIETPAVRSAVR